MIMYTVANTMSMIVDRIQELQHILKFQLVTSTTEESETNWKKQRTASPMRFSFSLL
jgi:hypothetical protein